MGTDKQILDLGIAADIAGKFWYQSSFCRALAHDAFRTRYCFRKSVCPSVCLSNAGTVSKQMVITSHFS